MRILIFLTTLLMTSWSSHAQISIGGSAGVNYSKMHLENITSALNKPEANFFVGLNSEFSLNQKINLLGDIQFSVRQFLLPGQDQDFRIKHRAECLEIQPKIEFRLKKYLGFVAGANVGVIAGHTSRFVEGSDEWNRKGKSISHNLNVGLTGAVRGHLNNVFIELGYFHGLSDFWNLSYIEVEENLSDDDNEYFRSFHLGVGYLFEL